MRPWLGVTATNCVSVTGRSSPMGSRAAGSDGAADQALSGKAEVSTGIAGWESLTAYLVEPNAIKCNLKGVGVHGQRGRAVEVAPHRPQARALSGGIVAGQNLPP